MTELGFKGNLALIGVAAAACVGSSALLNSWQRDYEATPLTALNNDMRAERSTAVFSNPQAFLDQQVIVRGELKFITTEKPWVFLTPEGLNRYRAGEDSRYCQSTYTLSDPSGDRSLTVRVDEHVNPKLFTSAEPTNYSGRWECVGTIKLLNGTPTLIVDHTPPQRW